MRYGVIPTSIAEWLFIRRTQFPIPLMDSLYAVLRARALMAAVKLGIFEALKAGPKKPSEIANLCGLVTDCVELLLRTLLDYVRKQGECYCLTSLGQATMIRGCPFEMVDYVEWNYAQWDMLEHLESMLRSGRGVDFHEGMMGREEWRLYLNAMLEIARFEAPTIARLVPVRRGARRLLDLGGAHGLVGARICQRHPPMRSVVIELPEACEHAGELARAAGIGDIVTHQGGDIRSIAYDNEFDVTLLANVLHHFKPDAGQEILRRCRQALCIGGTAAIWDIEGGTTAQPGSADAAGLFFRLTSGGRCYAGHEYVELLKRTGFRRVRKIHPIQLPGHVLVTGRKLTD